MSRKTPLKKPKGFDLMGALGASDMASVQKLSIYLPDRDRDDKPVPDMNDWIRYGMEVLTSINGGVTVLPPAVGEWQIRTSPKKVIRENTVVLFSFITDPEAFERRFLEIKRFVDKFGQDARQDSVMVEFFGEDSQARIFARAYFVSDYTTAQ